jgi:N-acetylmuramoyl-L-alanine amidase
MRIKATTIQQVVLGLALLAALCWNLAQANEINRLELDAGPTGTRAELHLQSTATFKTFMLRQPDRLVVDLTGVDAGKALQLPAPAGLIKAIRTGRPAEGATRIVFDLAAPTAVRKPRLETGADGVRLVLEWPGHYPAQTTQASSQPLQAVAPGTNPLTPAPTAFPVVDQAAVSQPTTGQTAASNAAAAPSAVNSPPDSQSLNPVAPMSQSVTSAGTVPASDGQSNSQPNSVRGSAIGSAASAPPAVALAAPKPVVSSSATPNTITGSKPEPESEKPTATLKPLPMPRNLSGRPLIVAIDAGHGGQDPGAIGPTGKREKDITLAISRELARQVNAMPGLKAVLTRDSDMFLPLTRRTQIARQAKADIFISIHADAAENRSAKGSSVYVLSLRGASSQRARWLADKENAADLIGGHAVPKADNTLTSVLLDLTQSGQMRASESAASNVLDGLKDIGYNHKPNIERANFAVLRTSDMPAMLVETAFISNPDEERRLVDPTYQRSLARAVLAGVDTYFQRQPPPGTLYAARAKAAEARKGLAQNDNKASEEARGRAATAAAKSPTTAGGSPD